MEGEMAATVQKVKISGLLAYYVPHAVKTNQTTTNPPPTEQFGYVLGGDGRIATDAYIRSRAKAEYGDKWEAYYRAYQKWLDHRVMDCNSLAEVYYKEQTGKSIDTKARSNYASWCSLKDDSAKDGKLAGMPQMPGVALFSGPNAAGITHVGFLFEKYGPGDLDWFVLEARGKDYGLVITTLKSRPWEWWGVMDKYFEYDLGEYDKPGAVPSDAPAELDVSAITPPVRPATRLLRLEDPMMKGEDVRALQVALKARGFDPGTIDGIFGIKTAAAVIAFRKRYMTDVTDEVGPETVKELKL